MQNEVISKLHDQLNQLQAKEDIRSLLYRYCRAVDRGDIDLMKSCYHADSWDDHGFFSGPGWEFADYVIPILAQLECCIHSLCNPIIDLRGERAYVETQWSVIHRLRRFGKLTDIWDQGRYLDELEYRDGEWRILNRVVVMDAERWLDTVNFLNLVPDSNPNKVYVGKRSKEDPVYRICNVKSLARPRFSLPDLWSAYRKLLPVPKSLLVWIGDRVRLKNSTGSVLKPMN